MTYSPEHVASMRRQAWLLEQAQGATQDDVTVHGHALRMEVMRTAGVYARSSEPADFERMQLAAEHLDRYLAGLERALFATVAARLTDETPCANCGFPKREHAIGYSRSRCHFAPAPLMEARNAAA